MEPRRRSAPPDGARPRQTRALPASALALALLATACGDSTPAATPGPAAADGAHPGSVATLATTVHGEGPPTPIPAPPPLPAPGEAIERPIEPEAVDVFAVPLAAGDYLELEVEQLGADVVVRLLDPAGEPVVTVDSPSGERGVERLIYRAPRPGDYRLELETWPAAAAGRYRLEVVARRPATPADVDRATATTIFHAALAASGEERVTGLEDALARWRALDDAERQASVLDQLGRARAAAGSWRAALGAHEKARDLFRALGERHREAIARQLVGKARGRLGDLEGAVASHLAALELHREVGDRYSEAVIHNDLGLAWDRRGERQRAIASYRRAAELWRELDHPRHAATAGHNLGMLLVALGEHEQGLVYLEEAAAVYRGLDARVLLAGSLNEIGHVRHELGDDAAARDAYREALELWRERDDRRGIGVTLINLARLSPRTDAEARRAIDQAREALAIFRRLEDPRQEGRALQRLAWLEAGAGRPEAARPLFAAARRAAAGAEDEVAEANALVGLGEMERRRGAEDAAEQAFEEAITIVDRQRIGVASPLLRAGYLARHRAPYARLIALRMARHRAAPEAGHDARALTVVERFRARALLDLLARGPEPTDPERRERVRGLRERLDRLAWERQLLRERGAADGRAGRELERRIDRLTAELRLTGGAVTAAATSPRPLDARAIRERVLDAGTALLVYALGEERSFLWHVTGDAVAGFELPPERELAALARDAHRLLGRGQRRETRARTAAVLCRLSELLIAPVAERLTAGRPIERLAIAADGALAYLPFAALPDPRVPGPCGEGSPPLLAAYEVVALPSASTLVFLRRRAGARPLPPGLVAVVADPVVTPDDPRIAPGARGDGTTTRPGLAFERLPATADEARAILALAPPERRFAALGPAAARELITGGALAGYRTVHFATHAVVDTEHPELSGLVLSLYDAAGQPRDGFLRVHELYHLPLAAELVVLSACRTALGRELRGEGLVGLTQGFLFAGASRVMVSLWRVEDRITAELMTDFYRRLLDEELSAAAALRQAQLAIRRAHPEWGPYAWAPFVLQGEWR